MDFWLGFMTAVWGATVVGVGYTIWRYVYAPWKVMRKDIAALNSVDQELRKGLADLQNALSPSRVSVLSDEELASLENRLRSARRKLS